jgi:hypothetical protein
VPINRRLSFSHSFTLLAVLAVGWLSAADAHADPITGRCADGTQEQFFPDGMVGCAGSVSFADRNTLCAPGFRTASSVEWASHKGLPKHNYWTNDNLNFIGSGTSACSVAVDTGTSCGTTPMRVCTALNTTGADPEGNQCTWQHCGLGENTPDQFFGGCSGNTTAGAICIVGGCADGSIEQTFSGGMVGCAATEPYANRATLCGPGYHLASATEWVALRGGGAPTHNYWTSDALKYNGTGPSSCFVSTSAGNDCGPTPMRVCSGTDPEGNTCNWTHCGLNANAPDQFFGGCAGNTTAGGLCVPNTGCADGSVEQVFANGTVGCSGAVTFANRATLCAPGYKPATALLYADNRLGIAPTHDYWTDDALKWNGSGTSACFVSTTIGNTSCGANPMRVCTASGSDPEGNSCSWTHCGLDANAPDQLFGGCASTTAGTLCTPTAFLTKVKQGSSFNALHQIWGSGPNDVYAVGDNDAVFHTTGNGTWTNLAPAINRNYQSIWGSSASDVYTVAADGFGGNPIILHLTGGSTWTIVNSPVEMEGVWGSAANDVWAVGVFGNIVHSTGGNVWTSVASPTSQNLNAVWGTSNANAYAVGNNGTILRWNGATWSAQASGTIQNFSGVWGSSATNIYAVAADGTIVHSTGNGTWTLQPHTQSFSSEIFGFGSNDIYLSSTSAAGYTGILHSVGDGIWNQIDPGFPLVSFRSVWGTGPNDLYFADNAGNIYHHP